MFSNGEVVSAIDFSDRWNEFGRAAWELQRKGLVGRPTGFNWKYVAYVKMGEDEATSDIASAETYISGKMYSDNNLVDLWLYSM